MKIISLFAFSLFLTSSCFAVQQPVIRVFVLAGQSNMEGQAVVEMDHPEHYNSGKGNLVDVLSRTDDRFSHLRQDDEWTSRDDVRVRFVTRHGLKSGKLSIGFTGYEGTGHFGPELQFGHVIGDAVDEPVLLIKTAWGGKSLQTDFRPPSAVRTRGGTVGPYYQKMMQEVAEALENIPNEFPDWKEFQPVLSGFIWQQGWNDMIDETARSEYFDNLVDLINDVRGEWNIADLPVVVGELGNGGKDAGDAMKKFRRQQARIDAHPPFVGNVLFAPTTAHARPAEESPNTGHGHHWFGNAESYLLVGDSLARQWLRLVNQQDLPRVLILGDSISMGYMNRVKQELANEAFVVRPMLTHFNGENCAGTDKGIESIDRWLAIGGGNWDVVHFNFGLHDLKHVDAATGKNSNNPDDPEQSPPEDYRRQLEQIVAKLNATKAALIFATTTPVPAGGVRPYRAVDSPGQYNEIAKEIMQTNGIAVNDLYSFANERLATIQQPVNVHFNQEGSRLLGDQVVEHIRLALKQR